MDDPEAKITNKDEIARLSHEIRSIAQGLLGYLQIFNDEIQPQLDAEQLQILLRINYFAKRFADLMLELLAEANKHNDGK
jgi:hypothetical protein